MSDTTEPEERTPDEKDMRAFSRSLFAPDPDEEDETDEQQKPPVGNVVPREGSNVRQSPPNGDLREFVRDLFDRTD